MVEEHEPDPEAPDVSAFVDAAATPPFLTDRRVIVVREVGAFAADAIRPLLAYLADPLPTTSLVLVAGGGRGALSPALVKAVKDVGRVVEAGTPRTARDRAGWLTEHLKGAPVRLDPAAATMLEQHLGEDLGRLRNLLEALAAAYGTGARLGPDDVEPFLGEAGSIAPWHLTDAIDRGDIPSAIGALQRMTGAGDRHPLQLMATLAAHYGRLLRLDGAGVQDDAGAAALLGIKGSTFPAQKARRAAERLGHDGIAAAIGFLAAADLDLRGAREWPNGLVLEVLVARLGRLSRGGAGRR
jgi:DNA polymerase-3 subunit delta